MFLVTCLRWLGKHRDAQTPTSGGKDFHNLILRRFVLEPWLKPGRSSYLEAVIGFEDCGTFDKLTPRSRKVLYDRLLHWNKEKKSKVKDKGYTGN